MGRAVAGRAAVGSVPTAAAWSRMIRSWAATDRPQPAIGHCRGAVAEPGQDRSCTVRGSGSNVPDRDGRDHVGRRCRTAYRPGSPDNWWHSARPGPANRPVASDRVARHWHGHRPKPRWPGLPQARPGAWLPPSRPQTRSPPPLHHQQGGHDRRCNDPPECLDVATQGSLQPLAAPGDQAGNQEESTTATDQRGQGER